MEIRDTRNGDWHWVYNALLADPHLTTGEKLVYSAISTFGGHQVIHPTKEQIAERCALDEKTVQRAIKRLEEIGYMSMDKNIGRGNANVYYLLKKSKGCNLCPFIKGDIEDHKRGHFQQEKGTETTPYIDIYKDKKDSSSYELRIVNDPPKAEKPQKADTAYRGVFELWGKYPLNWRQNRTEIAAAKNLLEEHGLEACADALGFYEKRKGEEMCPQILKPSDLDRKYANLLAYYKKYA